MCDMIVLSLMISSYRLYYAESYYDIFSTMKYSCQLQLQLCEIAYFNLPPSNISNEITWLALNPTNQSMLNHLPALFCKTSIIFDQFLLLTKEQSNINNAQMDLLIVLFTYQSLRISILRKNCWKNLNLGHQGDSWTLSQKSLNTCPAVSQPNCTDT